MLFHLILTTAWQIITLLFYIWDTDSEKIYVRSFTWGMVKSRFTQQTFIKSPNLWQTCAGCCSCSCEKEQPWGWGVTNKWTGKDNMGWHMLKRGRHWCHGSMEEGHPSQPRARGEESAKASQRSGVWAESGGGAAVSGVKTTVEKKSGPNRWHSITKGQSEEST